MPTKKILSTRTQSRSQPSKIRDLNWETDVAKFPRKQTRRDRWALLDGSWRFCFDPERRWNLPSDVPAWPLQIQVPFAPESDASGLGDHGFHPRCWYQEVFRLKWKQNRRYILHFGAVDYETRVWINNEYLGFHEGGYTPFWFDITALVQSSESLTLTVRADDDPHDLGKPRGKQDWQLDPHLIWYPRTSGIWQHVWIEEVSQVYIERLNWMPHLERWDIGVEAYLQGRPQENMQFRVRLSSNGKLLADDTYQVINREVHRRIALSDPGVDDFRNELLWSPERPNLIQAEVELLDSTGLVIDRIHSYTALRSATVHRGRFLLNGRPYYLRMILNQGYWDRTLQTPPSFEALKQDVELIKSAGFNGVRMHQKIEDPDFLYWADHLGLLVWGEMPSAYRFTHESVKRIMKEWSQVIDRDSNHPCIVVWVAFNESWGVPDLAEKESHQSCVQAMYHLTRTLDPSRLVIGNDGWESTATDLLGIHDYDDQPERLLSKYSSEAGVHDVLNRRWPGGRVLTVEGYPHQGQPILLTEFGGIACKPSESSPGSWGYVTTESADDFQRRYENLMDAVHRIEIFNGFCYTQFTDTFQEANGLFTIHRRPKFSLSALARATRNFGQTRGELTSSPVPPPLSSTGVEPKLGDPQPPT